MLNKTLKVLVSKVLGLFKARLLALIIILKKMKTISWILNGTAVLVSIAAVGVAADDMEATAEEIMASEQSVVVDLSVPPPEPTFNSNDNDECRKIVTRNYEDALVGYNHVTS